MAEELNCAVLAAILLDVRVLLTGSTLLGETSRLFDCERVSTMMKGCTW